MTIILKKINIFNLLISIISIYLSLLFIEVFFIFTNLDKKNIRTEIDKVFQEKKKIKILMIEV